ncbi:N-acetylmuramoyl-L-alanine amidase-like domain-containing protein [Bacteroides sp.]|uniref:N-acetylmuramoyl-L-alanine amidase-like domain-containing protein n=1 Tax=Bacteroides sp. TaxID=29523 RepID=UPI003AB8675C
MKVMTKIMLSALCAAAMVTSASAQGGKDVLSNGIKYLDVPYVAHTLEADGPEELVINCDEVDCTTLIEYVLAESLTPKLEDGDISESVFADKLQGIRYRDGKIDGYTSRLHYIADWINNGVRNGFLEDITGNMSADTEKLSLNYMSSHPEQYKQLANSKENVAKMKEIEQSLSGRTVHYLPKAKLTDAGLPWIKDGDIIAITTNTPGLDVAHMGIAFYADDKLTLLHASSKEKKVVVSKVTLSQMLKDNNKWTGIRVLRMKK